MPQLFSSKQREREFRTQKPKAATNGASSDANPKQIDKARRRKFLREYIAWLWPNRFAIFFIFLLALTVVTLDMTWPIAIKLIVDHVTNPETARVHFSMRTLGIAVIAVLALKQGLDSFRSFRVQLLNARVVFRLRGRLFGKLMDLPIAELGEMKSGGIISRLSGDVDSVAGFVQQAIISPGVAALRVLATIIVLVWLSWRLAVAALIALPILGLTSFLWVRKVRPIYRSMREDASLIDGRVGETFGGIRVVRAFRREKREGRTYAVGHHTVIRKSLFATRVELVLESAWGLLIPMTTLSLVWYGSTLVPRGQATVGSILTYQIYAVMLLQPVWAIVQSVSATQKSLAAMERIFGVLELPQDKPDVAEAAEAPTVVETFDFENVDFEYRPGVKVVSDFTLHVQGGMTVALVGPSGAGKTTVTDLVARFHDPTRGQIRINGVDLKQIRLRSYRSLLAVVQQETFLFDGSVRENIAYGLQNASDDGVIDAARRANAHEFIEQLPEKYETLIGERGFKLSGGQRQRISIARAILANPQILILDEATSNLDSESEQLIQASLQDLLKNRTTFVIAHRLSTITGADLIVAMEGGKIIDTGTHEQLLERRGLYFDMVERQRRSFDSLSEV